MRGWQVACRGVVAGNVRTVQWRPPWRVRGLIGVTHVSDQTRQRKGRSGRRALHRTLESKNARVRVGQLFVQQKVHREPDIVETMAGHGRELYMQL